MQYLKISFTATLIAATIFACTKDSVSTYTENVDCGTAVPTYTTDVKEIIDNNCALSGCHDSDSSEAGVDLEGYSAAKNEFLNGECLCTIYHDCKPMPEGASKLDDATIETLTCWVKNGCAE